MTDHDAEVAAVMAEAPCAKEARGEAWNCNGHYTKHPECVLAALTEAGYAVVEVLEGVEVEHGARLVWREWERLFAIEPPKP